MFVTSDIFDLNAIARFQCFEWRENLLCGIAVHGTTWRGYQAAAAFVLEAARRRGLLAEMKYASYTRPNDKREHFIKPSSFERLARGELSGAKDAQGIFLKGVRAAAGSRRGYVDFGGSINGRPRRKRTSRGPVQIAAYPYQAFDGEFSFPIDEHPRESASELLWLAADMLDAEYGYYYVRDDLAGPGLYCWGLGPSLDAGDLNHTESREIGQWRDFVREGRLWTEGFPLLRDLFEVNLISERHTSVRIEGLGYLRDWIEAQRGRGRLKDLGRGRLLWTLSDQEMFDVRPVLNAAGLLKSCRDRIYRDLHPGTGVKPYAAPWCYTLKR
jgi:hypothetical protein